MRQKKAQVGMEYLVVVGFLTFILIGTLAIALTYNSTLRDLISSRQVENMGNKIISSAEAIFYSGKPSKITTAINIPKGISLINITNNTLYISFQASSGENKISFPSNVPISGSISETSGLRKITLEAQNSYVEISS